MTPTTTTVDDIARGNGLDELAVCGAVRLVTGSSLRDPSDPDEPWPPLAFVQPVSLSGEDLRRVIELSSSTADEEHSCSDCEP